MPNVMLLTKEIRRKLPPIYTNEHVDDPEIIVKLFTPDAQATWYITEGSPVNEDGEVIEDESEAADWLLFGLCDLGLGFPELGYVMLSELESIRGPFGLPVERDMYYSGHTLSEVN